MDLSKGNSLTFRFGYNFLANRNANLIDGSRSYAALGALSLFDIGVTSGSDVFGSSADSFFISAVPTTLTPMSKMRGGEAFADVTGTYSLHGFTEDSVNGAGDGTTGGETNFINVGGGTDFVSGLALDSIGLMGVTSESTHGTGTAFTYELTFANTMGSGNFDVSYEVNQFTTSGTTGGSTVTFDGTVAERNQALSRMELPKLSLATIFRLESVSEP